MNRKGEVVIGLIVASIFIAGVVGRGLYQTSRNGVLKNNGKKIWCKVLNKGNDFCDTQYPDPIN